jgi:tetratricopeptide (TPR) repeat protein
MKIQDPPVDHLQSIINLYNQGLLQQALSESSQMLKRFPNSIFLYNIAGASNLGLMQFDNAIDNYNQVLKIKPDYAEAYYNLGVVLKVKGDLEAAIDSYKQALNIKPDYTEVYNNMGNALRDKGDLEAAIDSYKQALKIKPDFAEAYYNLGVAQSDKGDLEAAIESYKQALNIKPDYTKVFINMGVAQSDKGDLEAAIDSYKQALRIKPDFAEAYYNMGNVLRDKGDLEAAIESYKQALNIKPDYTKVFLNMGVALSDKGELAAAIDCFKQALNIKPDYAEAYYSMGIAQNDKGDQEAAIDCYNQALKIKPDYADAFNNMGLILKDKGNLEAAIDSFKQALKVKPDYAKAYKNICDVYEKSNKLTELSEVISEAKIALKEFPDDLLLYEALYYFRSNNYEYSEKLISAVNIDHIGLIRRPLFLQLKAKLHHYQKNYKLAFNSFAEMNHSVINSSDYKGKEAQVFFDELINRVQQLKNIIDTPYSQSLAEPSIVTPTFLIGFPRSGTTLLDTILRTHSKIDVIEEKAMLSKAQLSLGTKISIVDIENFTNEELANAKEIYFKELGKFVSTKSGGCVIDKLPLNIKDVPIIHKLFPTAKFILALRHPLDSILSSWMQLFRLNPAMANMVELDRIVDFYGEAMTVLELSEKRYSLNVHRIRYEDLVLDMKLEISNLLMFLELDWENELEDYQETAFKRGIINTPSYSQVIEPIYKTASYRWEKYRKPLEKYFIKIEKWTTKFGYEL